MNPAVPALERWFLRAPIRFVLAAIALWIGWALAAAAVAGLFAVQREVVPVLGQAAPAREAVHVLLVAPLAENALLWAVFRAAWFCVQQWSPLHADVAAPALATAAFALGHWPFKVLFGAEMLAGGWLLSMCFLWGERHRVRARGLALSVAAHVGVNTMAFALFHAR